MTADFYQLVRGIFDRAIELPPDDRPRFLNQACAGDSALLQEVERLLAARSPSESFMATGSRPAQTIGRYVINSELGRGGMGVVYDAHDPMIDRNVALKVINLQALQDPSEAEFLRDRLFREARSCGQLFHPGIVIIFDVGQEQQAAFIAMEKVDGPTLHRLLNSGRIPENDALRVISETAAALDYAHQHGIVHRDIKPANIMLRSDGVVKVADFGIAKIISGHNTTVTGVIMGTPSYMSPEQIEGRPVDGRSDQFSLAVVAFELLSGARPFQADSLPTIAHLIVYGERPSLRISNPSIPPAVDAVFARAFARMPEARFRTCAEFSAALQTAIQDRIPVVKPTVSPAPIHDGAQPSVPPVHGLPVQPAANSRNPILPIAVISLIVLICSGLGAAFLFRNSLGKLAGFTSSKLDNDQPIVISPSQPASATRDNTGPVVQTKVLPPSTRPADSIPSILEFRGDPPSIKSGTPSMLSWDVVGADTITIDRGVGKVAQKGMSPVLPTVTTTYTITATSAVGTVRKSVSVEVKPETLPPAVQARQLRAEADEERRAGKYKDAIPLLTKAVELGDVTAMVELGESYRDGSEGVDEDDIKAMALFSRAAAAGSVEGMLSLGVSHLLGINGGAPNEQEAAVWLQKAADLGNASAMYNLGTLYERGRGVPKNLEKAKELYVRSASLGNPEAKKKLRILQPDKSNSPR